MKGKYSAVPLYVVKPVQSWKNPLIYSPWRVPNAAGRVEILTVSNVNY